MWLKRFIDGVLANAADDDAQLERVADVLDRRGLYDNDRALLDALLAALTADAELSEAALGRVARALRVRPTDGFEIEPSEQLGFWRALADRFPREPYVHACCGDALRDAGDAGDEIEGLERGLHAIELDGSLYAEFGDDLAEVATRAGGIPRLRFQLLELRARLEDPDQADDVRERYSELLEDHRDDDAALARIRALGAEINQLVAEDKLPRAFVRRTR